METIKILHASDLHISIHKQFRSPVDKLKEINLGDWSRKGIWEKLKVPSEFTKAWWKKMAASSYDPEILRALAEFIYRRARRKLDPDGKEIYLEDADLDAVILTGDLATTGAEDDILQVRNFLSSPFNPKYPHKSRDAHYRGATLSAVKIPVVILPGNHDRYVPTRELTTVLLDKLYIFPKYFNVGGRKFDEHLSDFISEPVQPAEIERVCIGGKIIRIVILSADFTLRNFDEHKGFLGWLAQGKVHRRVLRKLSAMTQSLVDNKKEDEIIHILWACHFPPRFPRIETHSKLLGEDLLLKEANKLGVKAILAGHTHHQLKYNTPSMNRDLEVLCCGTTTQHEPQSMPGGIDEENTEAGNFFQILEIKVDEDGFFQINVEHYRYSSIGGRSNFLMGHQVAPNLLFWERSPR